ncbi:MAG: hypothetical protein WDN31_02270 [Hyphomicrobium sp.]
MSASKARKLTMLVCAFCVLPVMFATSVSNLWVSVLIIGVAAAAHQGFSANLFTVPSDTFPRFAVGAVIGIGGMVGAIGGNALLEAHRLFPRHAQLHPAVRDGGRGLFRRGADGPPALAAARAGRGFPQGHALGGGAGGGGGGWRWWCCSSPRASSPKAMPRATRSGSGRSATPSACRRGASMRR